MKIALVVHSNEPETAWNAFRFANTATADDNEVAVFLLGKGVEAANISSLQFDVQEQMTLFHANGGSVIGCGVCVETRKDAMPFLKDQLGCEMGSMQELYALIAQADRVLTF